MEKRLLLDLEKLEIPKFDGVTTNLSPKKGAGTPKDGKKTPVGVRAKEAQPDREPDPDYYELDLPEVNYIKNIHQTRTIYAKDDKHLARMEDSA